MSPTERAVGKPVTLHLRDGRRLHGILESNGSDGYTLRQSTGVVVVGRVEVEKLQIRQWDQHMEPSR